MSPSFVCCGSSRKGRVWKRLSWKIGTSLTGSSRGRVKRRRLLVINEEACDPIRGGDNRENLDQVAMSCGCVLMFVLARTMLVGLVGWMSNLLQATTGPGAIKPGGTAQQSDTRGSKNKTSLGPQAFRDGFPAHTIRHGSLRIRWHGLGGHHLRGRDAEVLGDDADVVHLHARRIKRKLDQRPTKS